MFLWLKTLYRKRAVTWPFIFYTIIWTLSLFEENALDPPDFIYLKMQFLQQLLQQYRLSEEEYG